MKSDRSQKCRKGKSKFEDGEKSKSKSGGFRESGVTSRQLRRSWDWQEALCDVLDIFDLDL